MKSLKEYFKNIYLKVFIYKIKCKINQMKMKQ